MHKSVQVNIVPHARCKKIQCKLQATAENFATFLMKTKTSSVETSAVKLLRLVHPPSDSEGASKASVSEQITRDKEKEDLRQGICNLTTKLIRECSQTYIGTPKDGRFIVDMLSNKLSVSRRDVALFFWKIKLDESFIVLGDGFGLSCNTANRIFFETVPKLAQSLEKLVVRPFEKEVFKNRLVGFWCNSGESTFIADCLEIEIEEPLNPVHQAMTWSEHKNCNTLKYLISFTPDGVINFISEGFGGNATNVTMIEDYANSLPNGTFIMVGRGFKQIDAMLCKNKSTLILSSSVNLTTDCSKEDAIYSKKSGSLRIYRERVIANIREFNF